MPLARLDWKIKDVEKNESIYAKALDLMCFQVRIYFFNFARPGVWAESSPRFALPFIFTVLKTRPFTCHGLVMALSRRVGRLKIACGLCSPERVPLDTFAH